MKAMKDLIVGLILFLMITSAWAGTLRDNFDDGNFEGWQEFTLMPGRRGNWSVIDGELHVSNGGPTLLLTIGDTTWKNYEIEFDVKPLEKFGLGDIDIVARMNVNTMVTCVIGDFLGLPMGVCFRPTLPPLKLLNIKQTAHPLLELGEWHHFKLEANGNNFTR